MTSDLEMRKQGYVNLNIFHEPNKYFGASKLYVNDNPSASQLLKTLADFKCEVKHGTCCSIEKNSTATKWNLFFTVESPDVIEKLREAISQIPGISPINSYDEDIVFQAKDYGYNNSYPIVGYLGLDATPNPFIFVGSLWNRFVDTHERVTGIGATDDTLYLIGLEQGERIAQVVQRINPENLKDKATIHNVLMAYGYCLAEVENDNSIKVSKSFFARKDRKCAFLRGLFDGLFSALYNEKCRFEETSCIGQNNDYCVFERKHN